MFGVCNEVIAQAFSTSLLLLLYSILGGFLFKFHVFLRTKLLNFGCLKQLVTVFDGSYQMSFSVTSEKTLILRVGQFYHRGLLLLDKR